MHTAYQKNMRKYLFHGEIKCRLHATVVRRDINLDAFFYPTFAKIRLHAIIIIGIGTTRTNAPGVGKRFYQPSYFFQIQFCRNCSHTPYGAPHYNCEMITEKWREKKLFKWSVQTVKDKLQNGKHSVQYVN